VNSVIHQCALERDIALFEAGDRTEVGEKGLTIRSDLPYSNTIAFLNTPPSFSGGQKVLFVLFCVSTVLTFY
jgi:hypothetical protein